MNLMIRFLRQLYQRFAGSISVDKPTDIVQPEELLSRFIFSRSHFNEKEGVVKPKAFLPDSRGETSVCRIADMSNEAIWAIGNSIRSEPSIARGDVACKTPQKLQLMVKSAPEKNYPMHAVIVGWPVEKDKQKMWALQLSQEAILHITPLRIT